MRLRRSQAEESKERAVRAGRTAAQGCREGQGMFISPLLPLVLPGPSGTPGDMPLHPHSPPPPHLRQTSAPSQCFLFYDQTDMLLNNNSHPVQEPRDVKYAVKPPLVRGEPHASSELT